MAEVRTIKSVEDPSYIPQYNDLIPSANNAGTTAKSFQVQHLFPFVNVDSYGAVGDGVTDDSDALAAATSAAGDYGTIVLTPGKTYLYSKSIPFRDGQTVVGYGATLKRADEIKSLLTASVAGDGTTNVISVADGSIFSVGQECALTVNATDTSAKYTLINRITGIAGNTITLAQNVLDTVSGATFTTSDVLIAVPIAVSGVYSGVVYGNATPRVNIVGLEFDGNRVNNTTGLRWELQREVSALGTNSVIAHCTFNESPAEGIVQIGNYSKVGFCHFENIGGNAVHLSGGTDCTVSVVTCKNIHIIERATPGVIGHQNGAVDFSNGCERPIISVLHVDTALRCIGNISNESDGGEYSDIRGFNCTAGYLDIRSTSTEMTLTGGLAENCTGFLVQGDGVNIKNVVAVDTPVTVSCTNSQVDVVSKISSTAGYCVTVGNNDNVINCVCTGGERGVQLSGSSNRNRVFARCIDNYLYGVAFATSGQTFEDANVVTADILLSSGFVESASYDAVDFGGMGILKDGSANLQSATGGSRVIDFRTSAAGVFVDGFNIKYAPNVVEFVRLNNQNNITCRDMTFPSGTTSTQAFTLNSSTGFTAIDNYALGSTTPLTGA